MIQQVFSHYEVSAYKNEADRPEQMYTFKTKRAALSRAKLLAETFYFPLVEVLAIFVNADDHNDFCGDELIAVWCDGERTS